LTSNFFLAHQVDAANDLALLKADGRFAPLPIAASRTGLLGGTVATVGFPDIGLQEDGI
jgi:S1-C subfamily serine protease